MGDLVTVGFWSPHAGSGMAIALVLSLVVGALVGLEREIHGHPAGLRTHMLVCLGSTLFTLVSVDVARSSGADPGRIAAQIVTGIGFLGAGAIVREGATIRGLTTAASIWTTAAIGLAIGAGPGMERLAIFSAALVLFTLWTLQRVETWLERVSPGVTTIGIHMRDTPHALAAVLDRVAERGAAILGTAQEPHARQGTKLVTLRVRRPSKMDPRALLSDLAELPGVLSVSME